MKKRVKEKLLIYQRHSCESRVATKKAKEIIESQQPSPLPHGSEQTMNEMVAEFESKLRVEEYGL